MLQLVNTCGDFKPPRLIGYIKYAIQSFIIYGIDLKPKWKVISQFCCFLNNPTSYRVKGWKSSVNAKDFLK